jgi:hypothetical protein
MTKISFFFILLVGLGGCIVTRQDRLDFQRKFGSGKLVAWNEDTVLASQFSMSDNYRFDYLITSRDKNGKLTEKWYKGSFKLFQEKVMLFYDEDRLPEAFESFLLIENRQQYLIQGIKDERNRMYLRILGSGLHR